MTEMDNLIILLNNAKIPYEIVTHSPTLTPMIIYPCKEKQVCDAICHKYSYGYEEGLLEMMGLIPDEVGDSVEGYLTAKEVFNRILNHYEKNKGGI
jgi:hypothetical protein